jgi:hypothetical protein
LKIFSVFLITVIVSTLTCINTVNVSVLAATSITKPAVPEFTIQIVSHPYDVPTTHSIDPYTGEEITQPGYHAENKSIEIKITNQPFTPYTVMDADSGTNITTTLCYNVLVKGHFAENWSTIYSLSDGLPTQSSGEYTVLSLPINYPSGGQVDFKVSAMAGYVHRPIDSSAPWWPSWQFTGEESESTTQTLTIPAESTATPEPTQPNPTPTVPEISLVATVSIIAAMLVATIALAYRKSRLS